MATNVAIPGHGTHNILYVCTVNDTIYAFDADNSAVSNAYWQTNFTGTFGATTAVAPANTDMTGACGGGYRDFSGNMGIVGTPVIDQTAGTMWVVVRTKETTSGTTTFVQRLHALDITTGAERANSPVIIAASAPGTGDGGSVVNFDPQKNNQRAALTLAKGNIYIAWSSHCDWGPYHGWLMAYNAVSLLQTAVYCDTPNGGAGGIWMSGQGPAADTNGNIFISTGNGSTDSSGTVNRAMSFLKLNGTNLNVMSWFSPYDYNYLNGGDWDLGSGGLLLIPGTSLAIGGGKSSSSVSSRLYLVNKDNMGSVSFGTSNTNIVQTISVTPVNLGVNHIHGAPVWWDGADGSFLYVWGESDHLKQYQFDPVAGMFDLPLFTESPTGAPINGMPGGVMSISANGTNAGTGIVWASHQYSGDANQAVRPGIIHAYDAQNVTNELWNSEQFSARDTVGLYAKYVPPTVANGKVYLATFSGQLNVYGLFAASAPVIVQQHPASSIITYVGEQVTFSVTATGTSPLTYQWYFNGTNLPGATASSFTIAAIQNANAGSYFCTVTNPSGFANSTNVSLSVIPAPTAPYAKTILSDTPLAYWRLDETNGSVAYDYLGGYNGVYTNVALGLAGYNSLDPDTAAGFGTVTATNSFVGGIGVDFAGAGAVTFSAEAWVKGSAQTGGAGIIAKGTGGGGEEFAIDTGSGGGKFRIYVRDQAGAAHNANGTIAPDGNWHHVVGVCDEVNGFVTLYVDGASNATAAISGGVLSSPNPLTIGSRQSGTGPFNLNFVGTIDEVAVYNYALSAAQVTNHYFMGTNAFPVPLTLQTVGTQLKLTWPGGTLQAASQINGTFTNVPGAASPFTFSPSNSMQFFRVKVR